MKKLHWVLIAAVGFYLWRRSRAAQATPKATISGLGYNKDVVYDETGGGEGGYFSGLGSGRKRPEDEMYYTGTSRRGDEENNMDDQNKGILSGLGYVRPRAILPGRGVMAPGGEGSRGMGPHRGRG